MNRLQAPMVVDTNGQVEKDYLVTLTPFAYLLDHEGRVVIRGIANDWRQLESLLEQEGTLQAGRASQGRRGRAGRRRTSRGADESRRASRSEPGEEVLAPAVLQVHGRELPRSRALPDGNGRVHWVDDASLRRVRRRSVQPMLVTGPSAHGEAHASPASREAAARSDARPPASGFAA